MRPDTLGVIGLGAIGGSIAWQASRAGITRVLGFARRPVEGVAAIRVGAVTELAPSSRFVLRHADLVVLAVPPAALFALLEDLAAGPGSAALCTDVAGVKGPVAAAARRLGLAARFAGSHPLTPTARRGFAAAEPAKFRGALVYVAPTGEDDAAAREIADFWASVMEAQPVIVAPEHHDAILSWTSHLPHAAAAAVAHALGTSGPRGVTYGPTARDATRLADANVEVWRDLLLLNRTALLQTLDGFESSLGTLRRVLQDGDAAALSRWLETAARWRRRLDA